MCKELMEAVWERCHDTTVLRNPGYHRIPGYTVLLSFLRLRFWVASTGFSSDVSISQIPRSDAQLACSTVKVLVLHSAYGICQLRPEDSEVHRRECPKTSKSRKICRPGLLDIIQTVCDSQHTRPGRFARFSATSPTLTWQPTVLPMKICQCAVLDKCSSFCSRPFYSFSYDSSFPCAVHQLPLTTMISAFDLDLAMKYLHVNVSGLFDSYYMFD